MNNRFITNKGQRKSNQDVILIEKLGAELDIFLLADGMGGYKNGEYAANFIVTHLYDLIRNEKSFNESSIQSAIDEVTRSLAKENEDQGLNMGATLGGIIRSNNVFHCFWVGDVKIFHIRDKKIIYESIEHNLKNELIKNKVFVESNNAKKYNHVVTRSIHNDISKSKIDYMCILDFNQDDYLMLTSDGVTDILSNYELLEILYSKSEMSEVLSELNDRLVKSANDNFSLILINK